MGGRYNASVRSNLVNFVLDGTLPILDFNNLRSSLKANLTTMWYGIQILNNSGSSVQQGVSDTYQMSMSLYNQLNPSYNFDLGHLNNKN